VLGTGKPEWNYFGAFPQLAGHWAYTSVGDGGVFDAMPFTPSTFAPMYEPSWTWGGGLFAWDLFETGHQLLVDGRDAFNAYDAPSWIYDENRGSGGVEIEGQPKLSAVVEHFDERTGDLVIREEQEMVRCDSPGGVDIDIHSTLTVENCPRLVPTGAKLVRRIHQGRDGRMAHFVDEWSSTDGQAHNIDAEYDSGIDDDGRPVWRTPGQSDYAEYGEYDEVALPGGQVGSFYTKDTGEYYDGCPPWLCYFDRQRADGTADVPSGSLTYAQRPDRAIFSDYDGFVLRYNRSVPATGTTTLKHAFGTGRTQGEAEALGADAEREFTPATPPAAQQQQQSQQQPQQAPAPVIQRASLKQPIRLNSLTSRLRGRRFAVKVVCSAGLPQGGTLKARVRQGKRWTIATRTYQCPAGGSRNVTFTVTRSQLRKLRRLGRRVRVTMYMVARDADGKPVSVAQIINLATR
jgi:hypothetical protein